MTVIGVASVLVALWAKRKYPDTQDHDHAPEAEADRRCVTGVYIKDKSFFI
jgi:hypothetical protein